MATLVQLLVLACLLLAVSCDFCYDDLGCFETSLKCHRRKANTPAEIETSFMVYSRENRGNGDSLDRYDIASITASSFRASRDTKLLVHGWTDSMTGDSWVDMKNALIDTYDVNVVMVDWSVGADKWYYKSKANTRVVGREIAKLIEALNAATGATFDSMHIIGHSLGAHIGGYAGEACTRTIGRVTGLDPAGPGFAGDLDESCRLDKTDASFVDVMHTDGEILIGGGLGLMDEGINRTDFANDVSDSNISSSATDNIDDAVTRYNSVLIGLLDSHAPARTRKAKSHQSSPWYNSEISAAKKERRRLERRWRKNGKLQIDREQFCTQRDQVNYLVSKAKRSYHTKLIEVCGADNKKLFNVANRLLNRNQSSPLPKHTDDKAMAESFIDYFSLKLGHQDFYPNNGQEMPGCRGISPTCDHSKAVEYFISSISSACSFTATEKGSNWDKLKNGPWTSCTRSTCPQMGYKADLSKGQGAFYLETNANSPYCQ